MMTTDIIDIGLDLFDRLFKKFKKNKFIKKIFVNKLFLSK